MSRPIAILACALTGHRWGVTSRSGLFAPRSACIRCGIPREIAELLLTPREFALGAVTLLCAAAAGALTVLTIGGAW